jgi:hypothetical protein
MAQVKLLNEGYRQAVYARHKKTGEEMFASFDDTFPTSDAALRKAQAKATDKQAAVADWMLTHTEFAVEAVVVNEPKDLVLVDRLHPPTVIFSLDDDPFLQQLSDMVGDGDWLQRLGVSHGYDLQPLANNPGIHTLLLTSFKSTPARLHLETLTSLRGLQWRSKGDIQVLPPGLAVEELRIVCPYSDSFTLDRVAALAKLKLLEVDGPHAAMGRGLSCKPLAQLSQLEVLRLYQINAADVSRLSKLPQLRVLDISAKETPKKPASLDVGQMPGLESLTAWRTLVSGIEHAAKLRQLSLSTLPDPTVLAHTPALEELIIGETPDAEATVALAARLPELKKLDVSFGPAEANYAQNWSVKQLELLAGNTKLQVAVDREFLPVADVLASTQAATRRGKSA